MRTMLIVTSLIALSFSVWGLESTYSNANQDPGSNAKGNSQGFTGFINRDMENEEVEFSGSVDDSGTLPPDYKELTPLKSDEEFLESKKHD